MFILKSFQNIYLSHLKTKQQLKCSTSLKKSFRIDKNKIFKFRVTKLINIITLNSDRMRREKGIIHIYLFHMPCFSNVNIANHFLVDDYNSFVIFQRLFS